MSHPGFPNAAVAAFLAVLTSATELRRQMGEFRRLAHATDETLARRGLTRSGEIRRIMGLPQNA